MYNLTVGELIELLDKVPDKNSHVVFLDCESNIYDTKIKSKLKEYQNKLFWIDITYFSICDGC